MRVSKSAPLGVGEAEGLDDAMIGEHLLLERGNAVRAKVVTWGRQ